MKWILDDVRCVRRFAFFPTSIYDSEINKRITIWLEPYSIMLELILWTYSKKYRRYVRKKEKD